MKIISAKLFAQIENDAYLAGTFNLQGLSFSEAAENLHGYLEYLKNSNQPFPENYEKILSSMEDLVSIHKQLTNINISDTSKDLTTLGAKIANSLFELQIDEYKLLPGGWHKNSGGGHRMIYQVTRKADGFHFSAINSGSGLQFHQKKSALHKELYNPRMTWHFPMATTENEKAEVGYFIERLFTEQLISTANLKKKDSSVERLYKIVLPSISHISGTLIESDPLPDYALTASQFAGSCVQRCLHQMLKINSPSNQDYVNFIFGFKHYTLKLYIDNCLNALQPFTAAVRFQINLAIENNLKILNTPGMFSETAINSFSEELKDLAERVNSAPINLENEATIVENNQPKLFIQGKRPVAPIPQFSMPKYNSNLNPPIKPESKDFFYSLEKAIKNIDKVENTDFALAYFYIEQLVLDLPSDLSNPLYAVLNSLNQYEYFGDLVNKIQLRLSEIQSNWFEGEQLPALNLMILKLMTLQMNIQAVIAKENNLPDFSPFVKVTMATVTGNTLNNPFWSTNNPALDKILRDFHESHYDHQSHKNYFSYYKELLASESFCNDKLVVLFNEKYGSSSSPLFREIRNKVLQALYMISEHIKFNNLDVYMFGPIISKVLKHQDYECKLRRDINPFFDVQLTNNRKLAFKIDDEGKNLLIYSPLYPSFISIQKLSDKLNKPNFTLKESPALLALMEDTETESSFEKKIETKSANRIQLTQLNIDDNKELKAVTQAEIVARDYFHLRTVCELQIALTLDYFTRHLAKLSCSSNQFYVESNLMQPGLLTDSLKNEAFLPQFEIFLEKGIRSFNKNGQYSSESLFFLRLDFLVSRYLFLTDKSAGLSRLKKIQDQLLQQLSQPNDADIIYVQQEYLFLILMTQMSVDQKLTEEFELATAAYFYIQSHANPTLHKALSHRIEIATAIAKFQIMATHLAKQNPFLIKLILKNILLKQPSTQNLTFEGGNFPDYLCLNQESQPVKINFLLGKLFENNMARTSLPLVIKHHPLIKHLGLDNQQECLMSADETYFVLPDKINEIKLFHNGGRLIVQKKWQIDGFIQNYELHALSDKHQASQASSFTPCVHSSLPAILTDNSMDFWQNTNSPNCGLLIKNNVPLYLYQDNEIHLLDKTGNLTGYRLNLLDSKWYSMLNAFESNDFILAHNDYSENTIIKLARYNLNFQIENKSTLILQETKEQVVARPSYIHPSISGLTLKYDNYLRFIMPVARFYPTLEGVKQGAFYPMVHDTTGKIAASFLNKKWKTHPPKQIPLWDYENSEKHLSLRIQDDELIADKVADALYLAYTYLSTHQPEKAWKILEDCNTRLGGLTGNPAELQYIAWICERLPKGLMPQTKKAFINTPSYVACRLKALSLLSDYLLQDRKFELKLPKEKNTANSVFAQLEHKALTAFMKKLPETIYLIFSDSQKMSRHLEHSFRLSTLERKRLLDYYQGTQQGNLARGALGYEWMCLSLAAIEEERDAIQARIATSTLLEADTKRLNLIDKRLSQLKPVLARSTILEKNAINLSLPADTKVKTNHFSSETMKAFEQWDSNLTTSMPGGIGLDIAVNQLSSSMKEHNFITHFPAYYEIALRGENSQYTTLLTDFCIKVLIANRHVPFDLQDSNIPLLANILYRTLNNKIIMGFYGVKNSSELIKRTSYLKAPAIEVYEAKDVYEDILAKPEDILKKEQLKPAPLITKELKNTSLLEQNDIKNYLDSQMRQPLDELISSYRDLHKKNSEAIAQEKDETFAGKALLALEQAQKSLGQTLLDTPSLVSLLQSLFKQVEDPLVQQTTQSWELALQLANQGPEDLEKKQSLNLKIQSKAESTISPSDLLSLFCRADAAYTIEKTALSLENAQYLHDLIHKALFEEIQSQLIKTMKSDFAKAIAENDADLAMQVLDFLAKEKIPGMDDPATIILQKAEAILLRPRQEEALEALLKAKSNGRGVEEKIEKIIPGGGKTKVILPIYAEKLAKGDNLVIVEVPRASLATNHVDLNRISQRRFGKRAYRFEFDRDSNSSSQRLEEIFKLFNEIITTRSYMVTTGDSIKALELKYIDRLLQNKTDRDNDWELQVYWLDKICDLLHNYTDALIDEVHLGLWFKKKLIYTTGASRPVSPALIQYALALYSYINTDFVKNAPKLPNDYDWNSFKQALAKKIISDPLSPLYAFFNQAVKGYGPEVEAELIGYVLGQSKSIPEAILHANPEEKVALSFFKQEISTIVKDTLCRKLNVKYGASKRTDISATEETLAIPYIGNMIPNEQSRFGNEFVSINTTIQKMLIEGISKGLLADQISAWQVLARQELAQNSSLKNLHEITYSARLCSP